MKVTCSTCDKTIHREAHRLSDYKKHYCDIKCRYSERVVWIGYIIANYKTLRPEAMAKHIGLPKKTMHSWIFYINIMLAGYAEITFSKGPIKKPKSEKVKTERKPYPKGVKRAKKRIKVIAPAKPLKLRKMVKEKKVEVVMPTRVVDVSNLKMVRIDRKTLIQVSKDIPEEVAIDNYYRHREESQHRPVFNRHERKAS